MNDDWIFHGLRLDALREQYIAGTMDDGVLRARLELFGYAEPWLTVEVDYCKSLKREALDKTT